MKCFSLILLAQSAGSVEDTNCMSAEGLDSPNECPGYDIKPSDCDAPILELWEMQSAPSLPLLPGLLWPRMVAPDRVLCMGQIELLDHLNSMQTNDSFNWIV